VDVRRGSPTFGQWVGSMLSAATFTQCYVPAGFAHGFSVLSPFAQIEYKCTSVYDPDTEVGVAWNDPALRIPWGIDSPMLSERDRKHLPLADVAHLMPVYRITEL
jgi:dTDP-4-dehydrorhamnose 3,5-epimerase